MATDKITDADIDTLAELSRLALSAEEKAGFKKDLNNILAYVEEVKEIPSRTEGKSYDKETVNTMRDDEVTNEPAGNTRLLIDAAPDRDGDYVKVKKIL